MTDYQTEWERYRQEAKTRYDIQAAISETFAPEDAGLQAALNAAQQEGLPPIQISPIQGKLLQLLATACNAHKILEIGSLAGYSGIWLARSLPDGGRLITLEVDPHHADVVRHSFAIAGVAERTEVRVGRALDLLPQLEGEAPFDLVFIDADKQPYPQYLEWALRLTRPGSIIVADNTIRGGKGFQRGNTGEIRGMAGYNTSAAEYVEGIAEYNKRIASDPRLVSLALALDDEFTDGFSISVVK